MDVVLDGLKETSCANCGERMYKKNGVKKCIMLKTYYFCGKWCMEDDELLIRKKKERSKGEKNVWIIKCVDPDSQNKNKG